MNRGPQTQASKHLNETNIKQDFEDIDEKKQDYHLLTPQRKEETFRKQMQEIRVSKTDDKKRNSPFQSQKQAHLDFKNNLLYSSIEKDLKYTGCNCRKSQCLKMYCTCFAVGKMCDQTCLCDSCKNDHDNMDRSEAINEIIEKDPFAFSKKTDSSNLNFQDDFCNCRKSNCVKKYCDCYRRGKACGNKCNCSDCNNCASHSELDKHSEIDAKKKIKRE